MKFSIILPVRNGGELVKECVQSIVNQTYAEFNLHILENCSTDGTAEWLKTLKDERIIIYPANAPLTIEENWGRIISIPKNEYMTMIGHDDLLDENYLAVMNELIEKYPDASLYQAHFRYIDAKGGFVRKCKPMKEKQQVMEFLQSLLAGTIDTMGTGYLMKSNDYSAMGGMEAYPNLLFADHALWIKLTAANFKITSPEVLFSYRLHENLSKKSDAVRYIRAFYRFLEFLIQVKSKNPQIVPVLENHVLNYIKYFCRSLSHRLLRTPEKLRGGMRVTDVIDCCIAYADKLNPGQLFSPGKQFNIRIAKAIDDNIMSRKLYIFFRKFHKKPIYTKNLRIFCATISFF